MQRAKMKAAIDTIYGKIFNEGRGDLLPGLVAGTILTFVPVIGTFVVSDILGGRQVILVGNLVQRQFLDARNPPSG